MTNDKAKKAEYRVAQMREFYVTPHDGECACFTCRATRSQGNSDWVRTLLRRLGAKAQTHVLGAEGAPLVVWCFQRVQVSK